MSKNLFTKFFVFLLVVGLLFAVAPTKQADAVTLCVEPTGAGGCYTTISAAITAASAGDTINVAAGIYNENLFISKALTLLGPNAGISAGVTPGTRGSEAVIKSLSNFYSIYVSSDNVTIDGFTIDGASLSKSPYSLGIYGGGNNFVVQNNIFIGFEAGTPVYMNGTSTIYKTGLLVKDNSMVNATLGTSGYNWGMWLIATTGTVTGNVVSNYRGGIWVQSAEAIGSATVSGNIFNIYDQGIWFYWTKAGATADWHFIDNDITGIAYPSELTPDRFNAINVEKHYGGSVDFVGNSILVGASNATSPLLYSETDVTSGTRNAEGNWWGNASGPAAGMIVGTIDYDPWCTDQYCTPPEALCTTVCYVDAVTGLDINLGNAATPFKTIQQGVDTVLAGGTVNVAAGDYHESLGGWRDLEIFKSLSLIGAGKASTTFTFSGKQHGIEIRPDATGNVTIQGITFAGSVTSNGILVGEASPGGHFENLTFKDIEVSNSQANNLLVLSPVSVNKLIIDSSSFHHAGSWGAWIQSAVNDLVVSGSSFTYNGTVDVTHGIGFDITGGVAKASVTNSQFNYNKSKGINITGLSNAVFDNIEASYNSGHAGQGHGFNIWEFTTGSNNILVKNSIFTGNAREGIMLGAQGDVSVTNLTFASNQIINNLEGGVILWDTSTGADAYVNLVFHHNRIVGNPSYDLGSTATNTINAENNWFGCNDGSCIGKWGAFDTDPWLVMNVTDLPATVLPGDTRAFAANLTKNNLGTDTSAAGYLPSTTSVAFTPAANVDPDSDTLTLGVADTTFTAPGGAGAINICAVLDNATVCDTTEVPAPLVTYADDSWTAVLPGADPDGAGPAVAFGYDAFLTIQEAIDAVAAGGTVNVFPGVYSETAANRTIDAGGTYQFGLYFDSAKPGITLQGVKADGALITDAADVAAQITTNSTSNFGPDGVYVEADNTTITGLKFLDNVPSNNKTVTIVADNFTFKDNVIAVLEGGSVYFDGSGVKAYNVSENLFKFGASLDISSGAGLNGLASGRVIANNVFTADGADVYWASISFNGIVPGVGWFVSPVGGATITGNTFTGVPMPIRTRGTVEDDFDWVSYVTGNNFEKAVMAWDPIAGKPRPYSYIKDGVTFNNTILIGTSIQDEIGHAQPGDEVRVIKGTFVEDVTVNKDITLKGIPDPFAVTPIVVVDGLITITADGATVTNLKVAPGAVTGQVAAISVYAGNTTVSGNLIDGMAGDGTKTIKGIHVYSGGPAVVSNVAITGNTVKNISNLGKGTDGIMLQGVLDGVAVTGNTVQAISSAGWAYGIEVTPTGSAPSTPPQNVVITGNTVDGVTAPNGAAAAFSVDAVDETHPADASEVQVHQNVFLNASLAAVNKDPLHELDATLNYWGTSCGPVAGTTVGDIRYYPWNVDAAGTAMGTTAQSHDFTVSTGVPTINATIACAPSNSTFNFAAGSYLGQVVVPGGGQEHLTLRLADGVVLNGSSPCVTVNADYTTISAQTIGMAACVTVAGSNGIDVAAGVKNLTVDGLEIYGPGNDGIHFNGVITDVVLKDNFIHNLAGNGVFFGAQPVALSVGGIDIHGNMFQNNALNGIEAGAFIVPAEYNSWGNVAGAAAGDGASAGVDAYPFTHVDLYLESSGTPWANQVVSGQTITYTVMGNLVNANAADFALTYPANLTFVSSTASNSFGVEAVTHTAGTRTLRFVGYSVTGNKTGTLPIFSVTFTAGTPVVNAPMLLDELTDGFGMVGVQSSSNIYAAALLDSTVTIVTLPTISSSDIQGYYLSGEQRQFSVVLDNPSTGANYAHVYVDFTMTNAQVDQISLIEYSVDGGTTWVALGTGPGTSFENVGTDIVGYFGKVSGGGFPMAPGASLTTLFRVTFVTRDAAVDLPTSYAVSMKLMDADALPAALQLDDLAATMQVYDKPTVTYTSDPYFIIGEAGNFGVTINNPATGKNYANTAVFDVVLQNHLVADITAISCTDGTTTWNLKDALTQDGANVKARIGGLIDGFFTIPAPLNVTLPCTVTYATAGTYTTSTSMVDVVSPLPERVVSADIPGTATVYAKPVITATNLGGPFDAGLPKTVSLSIANASIPEPFEVVFSYPAGTVIVYNGDTYTCAATCPVIPVELTAEPTVLAFTVTFDEAWTGDVSVSLFDSDWTPADRLLASASATGAVVNGDFDVTGTFSMQGRATRAGIPVTLTWGGNFATYAPTANTIEAISNNFSKTVTYGGYYTITTNQPRYLNVYADLTFSKIIDVHADYPLPALTLRAGNAVWVGGNNVVDLDDANLVGTQWGQAGNPSLTIDHGDVNFDNKVNIQDLALVGGNYSLTSAGAYGTTWVP